MKAWVSGKIIPQEQATIPVLAHCIGRGSAIFEVLDLVSTTSGPAIFRADAHVERLFCSAECLHMVLPVSRAELIDGMVRTVHENGLTRGGVKVLAYWPQVEYGLVPRDLRAEVAVFCYDFTTLGVSPEAMSRPISAGISSLRKLHPETVPVHAKAAGHYVNGLLAKWDAKQKGYDEAILLDHAGNVAEGPTSSFFVVSSGVLRTPPLGNVLAGITRDCILRIARDAGIPHTETDVHAAELAAADEAFFTGTHVHVKPIHTLEGRVLVPCPGPVTARLEEAFEAAGQGRDPRYTDWLTFVRQ